MIVQDVIVYPQSNPSNYASTMAATDHNVSEIQTKASIAKPKAIQKNEKKGEKNMDRLEKTNNSCK